MCGAPPDRGNKQSTKRTSRLLFDIQKMEDFDYTTENSHFEHNSEGLVGSDAFPFQIAVIFRFKFRSLFRVYNSESHRVKM